MGTKFSSKSELCIMVGYTSSTKIWKLYSLERHPMSSHKIFTSADVKFDDTIFPTNSGIPPLSSIDENIEKDDPFRDVDESDCPEGIESDNPEDIETNSSNDAESNDDTSCSNNELDAKNNEPEVYDRRSLPPPRS